METAIVLPLLLLLVFGLIDFGRMFNAQITVTEAAREGARTAALGGDVDKRVSAVAGDVGVRTDRVQRCPEPVDTSKDAQVDVAYDFTFVTPVGTLAALFGGNATSGEMTLTARSVMPCQQ